MKHRHQALLCLACAVAIATVANGAPKSSSGHATAASSTSAAKKPATTKSPAPAKHAAGAPAGPMLSDSTVLARVDDRKVIVADFNDAYFASDPQYRPKPDSLGRVEFLNSMVNKEVLGITALAINKPLGFEDRATIRDYNNRILSNVLYQRMVIDSIKVTEQDIQKVYDQFKYEVHLKHIQLPDRGSAEKVRGELLTKKLPWSVAVQKYSKARDREKDGDMGWRPRLGMDAGIANAVFPLQPGQISDVLEDPDGFHIVQLVDRRPTVAPSIEPLRPMIHDQIVGVRATELQRAIQKRLLANLDVKYDDANIAWAASKFTRPVTMSNEGAPSIDINPSLPEIETADRDRVLGRFKGGQVTMDQLLRAYDAMPTMLRPTLTSPSAVQEQVDGVILEPVMVQLAHDRGIDNDPVAVKLMNKKLEEIQVGHMFEDSIQSKVRITDAMRRKYYEDNKKGFITYPYVKYAVFSTHSRGAADSLKARLAHEKAEAILLADSLAGIKRGSIQERYENQHGPYQKVLFEELRAGQSTIDGPDKQGDFLVLQSLAYDPGHQLKFEEVERMIDESLQNQIADQMLQQFVARKKKAHKIEAHPELVMRFALRS